MRELAKSINKSINDVLSNGKFDKKSSVQSRKKYRSILEPAFNTILSPSLNNRIKKVQLAYDLQSPLQARFGFKNTDKQSMNSKYGLLRSSTEDHANLVNSIDQTTSQKRAEEAVRDLQIDSESNSDLNQTNLLFPFISKSKES